MTRILDFVLCSSAPVYSYTPLIFWKLDKIREFRMILVKVTQVKLVKNIFRVTPKLRRRA